MVEKLSISTAQDRSLAARFHKPQGVRTFPVVILLHGFLGHKEEEHIVTLAEELALNGIGALRFDTSGFGESEGSLEEDFRFSNYLEDARHAYGWLVTQSFHNGNVAIWGHSMGAQLAIVYASEQPALRSVCAVSPPTKLSNSLWLGKQMRKWKDQGYLVLNSSKYGSLSVPAAFIDDTELYDTRDFVIKLTMPLLLIVGLYDDTVSPADSELIYKVAPEPKTLREFAGMGHDYKKFPQLRTEVNGEVVSFFKKSFA